MDVDSENRKKVCSPPHSIPTPHPAQQHFHCSIDRLKKLARVESGQLFNSSIYIVITIETDHSDKIVDSTRANFFKRSLCISWLKIQMY